MATQGRPAGRQRRRRVQQGRLHAAAQVQCGGALSAGALSAARRKIAEVQGPCWPRRPDDQRARSRMTRAAFAASCVVRCAQGLRTTRGSRDSRRSGAAAASGVHQRCACGALLAWRSCGGCVVVVTVAVQHAERPNVARLWDTLGDAWPALLPRQQQQLWNSSSKQGGSCTKPSACRTAAEGLRRSATERSLLRASRQSTVVVQPSPRGTRKHSMGSRSQPPDGRDAAGTAPTRQHLHTTIPSASELAMPVNVFPVFSASPLQRVAQRERSAK